MVEELQIGGTDAPLPTFVIRPAGNQDRTHDQ